jgi:glycosyltransferase involved in cell wall biosynthesis
VKVAVVIDSLSLGGAERLLATLASAAPAARLDLSVISIAGPDGRQGALRPVLESAGLSPVFLNIPRLAHPAAVIRVSQAIRRSGCSVVHAHLEYACTLAPPAAAWAGRPTVCSLHHVPTPLRGRERWKEQLAVGMASHSRRLIFVSRAAMAGFAARYHPRGSWTVLPNGIDLAEFHPGPPEALDEFGIPAGTPVVALIAALRPGKGHSAALKAWPAVIAAHPGARLLFVGGGPLEEDLCHAIATERLAESVVVTGLRSDIARLMRAATVVILPSEREALPTVLMEAAGCARPVIATRVGGIPEVVTEGKTGWLLDDASPERLSRTMIDLLGDRAARAALGAAAHERAVREFGMQTWARQLRDLYEEAVDG